MRASYDTDSSRGLAAAERNCHVAAAALLGYAIYRALS